MAYFLCIACQLSSEHQNHSFHVIGRHLSHFCFKLLSIDLSTNTDERSYLFVISTNEEDDNTIIVIIRVDSTGLYNNTTVYTTYRNRHVVQIRVSLSITQLLITRVHFNYFSQKCIERHVHIIVINAVASLC